MESPTGGQILRFIQLPIPKMLVKDVHCEILWDVWFPFAIKIVKNRLDYLLPPHLKAHAHLMLEIYLYIMA